MTNIEKWTWIVDKNNMTCKNAENNVTVKMNDDNGQIRGKIEDMPMDLFGKIAEFENGEKIIMQIVKAAEEEYSRK